MDTQSLNSATLGPSGGTAASLALVTGSASGLATSTASLVVWRELSSAVTAGASATAVLGGILHVSSAITAAASSVSSWTGLVAKYVTSSALCRFSSVAVAWLEWFASAAITATATATATCTRARTFSAAITCSCTSVAVIARSGLAPLERQMIVPAEDRTMEASA